ncbi:MAG: aminoacyltransferase [Bacilli bacterium]|nr:aminoacyltransferase [Bacilli bacterium]
MNFVEITKNEYEDFASKYPFKNFLQSTLMAEVALSKGHPSYYVGIKKNRELIGAAVLTAIKNKIGLNYFYAPRGPLLDYNDNEAVSFFTDSVRKFVKKRKGYVLHIDPLLVHKQRDINGDIVPNGADNGNIIAKLEGLGYIHNGFNISYDYSKQIRWVFCLDLENKSEKEVFSSMKQNHRNIIKKTDKFCLEIKELSYDELSKFKEITENTSERRNFQDKPLSYYQKMYKLFESDVKFVVAYLNTTRYLSALNEEFTKENNRLSVCIEKEPNSGKTKELKVTVNSLIKRIEEAKGLVLKGGLLPLSAAMFLIYEGEVTYLFSGSYKEYMHFYAQYAIQWYMIKYALENKCKRYNFYGITGNFDKRDKEYGVYEFKKGFNGYVEEYIGDFDLPVTFFYKFKKIFK